VLALYDINELRRHEREAIQAREFAESVTDAIQEPLLVLDPDFRIRRANSAACELLQMRVDDLEDHNFFEVSNGVWDKPDIRERLSRLLPEGTKFDNMEIEVALAGRQPRRWRLSASSNGAGARQPVMVVTVKEA
jgi:PAS domain-containing protein